MGRKLTGLLLCATSLTICGCAPIVTAWKNDPLQAYDVAGPSIYAMTGDRRTAVFADKESKLKYCAESMPDAVAAYAASSRANAKVTGLKNEAAVDAAIGESTAAALLQTFQRTENAEITRQMGWNICLAWSQGGITDAQYFILLDKLVTGSVDAMKVRAAQPLTATASNGTITVSAGNPFTSPTPTPSASPTPTPSPAPSPASSPSPTPSS